MFQQVVHIEEECKEKACDKKCTKRHIKTCRYGPRCKRKVECQFKHCEKDHNKKIILQEKLEVENLKKEVRELKKKIEESKILLEDTLHDNDILRAEKVNLKKEIKSLKLQIKEQQEEVLSLKTKFAQTSSANNSNNILETGEAKDGNKISENIENNLHVEILSF